MARHATKEKDPDLTADEPPVFGEQQQAEERRQRAPRERQFPALYGEPEVEVAERTADHDTEPTGDHVKDFVTTKRDWATADHDERHAANIAAVRQYMVSNGLRPDADVTFEGEHDHPDGKSVILRYTVSATPASVATDFDLRHTVIPQTGETGTDRAEHDAARETRLKAGHDDVREGTAEADRSAGEEKIAQTRRQRRREAAERDDDNKDE